MFIIALLEKLGGDEEDKDTKLIFEISMSILMGSWIIASNL